MMECANRVATVAVEDLMIAMTSLFDLLSLLRMFFDQTVAVLCKPSSKVQSEIVSICYLRGLAKDRSFSLNSKVLKY